MGWPGQGGEGGLGATAAGMRPADQQLGGAEGTNAGQLQQPGRDRANQPIDLAFQQLGLGDQGVDALGGAAQGQRGHALLQRLGGLPVTAAAGSGRLVGGQGVVGGADSVDRVGLGGRASGEATWAADLHHAFAAARPGDRVPLAGRGRAGTGTSLVLSRSWMAGSSVSKNPRQPVARMAARQQRRWVLAVKTNSRSNAILDRSASTYPAIGRCEMRQVRIDRQRRAADTRWRRRREQVLPMDPRDPDVTRAKQLRRQRGHPCVSG
jgi:hypothetical protein